MYNIDHISPVALITTGRTGTDFLQSLFDSHTQVLTFNGHLIDYYLFWKDNVKVVSFKKFEPEDLACLFVAHYLKYLKSHYDIAENKDRMGDNFDESISIDLCEFVKTTSSFMKGKEFNSRNFLLAVHVAYATCLREDISSKKVLLYHIHHEQMLPQFLEDFPNAKIICMTRDPRANYYSGIQHRLLVQKNNKNRSIVLSNKKLYLYLRRIFEDAYPLDKYSNDYMVIKLEDLGKKCLLEKLCYWLEIKYETVLEFSTFGGIRWRGDSLSPRANESKGWSPDMINNRWNVFFSPIEKYVFNFILNSRLKHYSYHYDNLSIKGYLLIPFLILIPLRLELDIFMFNISSKRPFRDKLYTCRINIFGYLKRVFLFFKYYFFQIKGDRFKRYFLICDK
ncbi:hypothetical protein HOL24_03010 [bacterium]|jgi:hypothetical protein|nr:hypothetical protein [bacterium]